MRRWWPVFVLFLIALVGVWFWSLGSLPREEAPQATVAEMEEGVTVRRADGSEEPARAGLVLVEGDTVITGPEGKATLDWFGGGETRLGSSSELTVQRVQDGEEGPLVVRLRLETGRAWTRVLRLLEIDADVSVETHDVVATVRGTSFDLETSPAGDTTIWVADSVVEAAGATVGGPSDGFFIPEGSMASFGSGMRTTGTRLLSDEDRTTDWFRKNREADDRFRNGSLSRMKASLAMDRAPAGGFLRTLAGWSEQLRVRFAAGARRERLMNRYVLRHLMAIRQTAEAGKSGLAYQEFARMDGEMKSRLASEASKREMRAMVMTAQRLFQDVAPSSPAYRIKQQVEEWSMHMAQEPADRLHARLMTIDSRLDEAVRAMNGGETESASQVLILARQGLSNVERERREASVMKDEHVQRLRKAWKALSVRADALDARLNALDEPPAPEPVPAEDVIEEAVPTSTEPAVPTVVTSTSPAPEPAPEPQAPPKPVSMTVTPDVLTVGFYERVTYRAILVYDTGLTRDVTKSARFTMNPAGYGSLFDNVFSAFDLRGTIVVTAAYEESGVPLQAQATLTIVDRTQ